jgi:hypothetical protein
MVHSNFKWPISVERVIDKPASDVWAAISEPGNLARCHPFCKSNPVQAWPGVESRDEVHYLNGLVFERRFRAWLDGVGYDLDIGTRGGRQSSVSWRITALGENRSALRITVCAHGLQNLPVVIRWLPHVAWLRPQLRKYLDSVVRGFEWFLERGEAVPRNAFGSHRWFSAR